MALSTTNKTMLTRSTCPIIIHLVNLVSFPFQRRLLATTSFNFNQGGIVILVQHLQSHIAITFHYPTKWRLYQLLQLVHHGAHTVVPLPHLLYLTQLCHHLQNATIEQGPLFSTTPQQKPNLHFQHEFNQVNEASVHTWFFLSRYIHQCL